MTISERARQSREKSAHLQRLLSERDPGFLAALRLAEYQVDAELSRGGGCLLPCASRMGRAAMNRITLYHSDETTCTDQWTCLRDDHTTVPPRCGARTAAQPASCELPAGHPGPHLPAD